MNSLFLDRVPDNWTARAYPSLLPLGAWFADLQLRIKELEGWVTDFTLPNVVWLAGFFNPQSFLTGSCLIQYTLVLFNFMFLSLYLSLITFMIWQCEFEFMPKYKIFV